MKRDLQRNHGPFAQTKKSNHKVPFHDTRFCQTQKNFSCHPQFRPPHNMGFSSQHFFSNHTGDESVSKFGIVVVAVPPNVHCDREDPFVSDTTNRDDTKQSGQGRKGTEEMRACRWQWCIGIKGDRDLPVLEHYSEFKEPMTRDAQHEV